MKRLLSLFLMLVTLSSLAFSQELTVKSFKVSQGDILARTAATCRYDTNDKYCALIKVGIALDGVEFECSGGVRDVVKKTGEYWVYLPQNNSKLRILHKDFTPLEINFYDYGIGKAQSGVTYVLTLTKPVGAVAITIKYSPSSATVLVDNKMVRGNNGVANITLPVGLHSYIVASEGYESEEGSVKLKASSPSNLQITLVKDIVTSNQVVPKENIQEVASSNSNGISSANSPSSKSNVTKPKSITIHLKKGISIEMMKVEADSFIMGATSTKEEPDEDEKPAHEVIVLQNYYLGKYEVTQEVWKAVMGNNPSKFKGPNLPVEMVSWNDCQKFIAKLNRMTGLQFRFPTEAEWEFAARGGKESKGYLYSGSDNIADVAWYFANSNSKTHPVGLKKANELGLYDMSGNVMEWCQDWYGRYGSLSQKDPVGSYAGTLRINRGGCWYSYPRFCRSSSRNKLQPDDRYSNLGFRLALSE